MTRTMIGAITLSALVAVGAAAQTVHEIEALPGCVPAQEFVEALDGFAVVLEEGASLEIAVPVEAGASRIAISVIALGETAASLDSVVEDETQGRHFVPAGAWGTVGIGVETGAVGREADLRLTASGGAVALDQVTVEKLEEARETLPLVSAGELHRETPLIVAGEAAATLLLPRMEKYRAVAEEFAADFEAQMGVALPTLDEAEATDEQLAETTAIMVGNLATGPRSLQLYARRLIYSDGAFPGAGGYELRTVHDAWGPGANAVYLGASDPEGCRAAAEAFLGRIEQAEDVTLPVIVDWQSEETNFGPVSEERITEEVAKLKDYLHSFSGAYQYKSAAGRPSAWARAYYLGGAESHARMYAEMVRVLAEYYEQENPDPPTFTLDAIVAGLDQIEECEALTDEERLMAQEWVRQIVEDSMDFWEMREPIRRAEAGKQAPTWNHQTHPALGIAAAAEYFDAHFTLPPVQWWAEVVDNLFEGQETAYKPLEDSANYQWITIAHTMKWALITGDMDIFENGTVAKTCELAIACHDNFGNEATFGDPWIEFGSNARTLMRIASLYYDRPEFWWLTRRLDANAGTEEVLGYYNWSGEAAVPEEQIGLTSFILDPAVYEQYDYSGPVPAESALDKAVFRDGFDPEDSYLMLDGISMGIHDHDDANAIIRFTANNRLWLTDMDYIRATPKWHNSILLSRDGETTAMPGLSELVAEAEFGNAGIVQSRAPGYAWADWTRTVFWMGGPRSFFLVFDQLTALEPGDFRATAVWRTLGETEIVGNTLEVEQEGEHFRITSADGSRLSLRETWDRGHGNDRGYYSEYPHAGKMTQVLHQDKQATLDAGESIRFVNLFEAGDEAEGALEPIGSDLHAIVTDGGVVGVFGIGPFDRGDVRIDAAVWIIGENMGTFVDLREISLPGLQRTADAQDLQIDQPDVFGPLMERLAADAQPPPAPAELQRPELPRDLDVAWRAELPSDVRCTDVWGLSSPAQIAAGTDGGEIALLSADGGEIALLSADGEVLWTREAEGMVRAVRFIDLNADGTPELLSGADDAKLRAYDLSGDLLWEVEIEGYHGRSGSVASVCAAQLDDDAASEVVIGSDNWHHYGFDSDGTELWRTNTTHASTVCATGDMDGDGRDEVAAGSEYYGSKVLDDTGNRIGSVSGGPNWPAAAMVDIDLDGAAEVLFGADDEIVRALGHGNEKLWDANVGGSVTDIVGLAGDGSEVAVAVSSEAGSVYGFDAEGALVWRTELPEQVSDLATLNTQVAAACDDGTVYLLGADGAILGGHRADERPAGLSAGDLRGAGSAAIIGARGDEVLALSVD